VSIYSTAGFALTFLLIHSTPAVYEFIEMAFFNAHGHFLLSPSQSVAVFMIATVERVFDFLSPNKHNIFSLQCAFNIVIKPSE